MAVVPVAAGCGRSPVEMFASSGGAVTALALVAAHPDDVTTLVAHEPPLIAVLPDAEAAERARAGVRDAYQANGSGAAWQRSWRWRRGEANSPTTTSPSPRRIPPVGSAGRPEAFARTLRGVLAEEN
jgi:pimeloyl-ACP methyl ester carboxylesterase